MRIFRFLPILTLIGRLFADPAVHFEPAPDWIAPSSVAVIAPTPPSDLAYGYDYLLVDNQQAVGREHSFFHYVYRITSEGALQSASRLTWDFDPAYERLTLHHLRVIRAGEVQERLRPGAVQVIQQEKDLDRHLLNGDLTALIVLDDIRVGDVIDYAFSREGRNPVFGGRYFGSFSTGWSVPVRHQRQRMIVPPGRTLRHREHGPSPLALTVSQRDGDTILEWEGWELRPVEKEKETPAWFDDSPWIQLSEADSWAEVVRWAGPLYAQSEPLPETVRQKSLELTQGLEGTEARTLALLQFVQQEIRYLGMELGAGSYRPNPPAVVLARRFGDCKDKTLLFCTLMRAAGLTAHPALLHTDYRDKLAAWLPTPVAFDHVIACVEDETGRHWVDPTLTSQQGGFGVRGLPDYRLALVVRPGGAALDRIDRPDGALSRIRSEETFEVAAFDRPARLRVRTRSTGMNADSARRQFAENTPEQIARSYVNYYATAYPGLTSVEPPRLTDDQAQNATLVEETYDVPDLWKRSEGGKLKAEFYPKFITDFATRPDTVVRTTPLGVRHPVDVQLVTTVNLPEDWTITPEQSVIEDDAFRAESGIGGGGRVVTMHYAWQSRRDHVPTEAVPAHLERLNRYRNGLGYTLTYTKPAAPAAAPAPAAPRPFRMNWLIVLVELLTLAAAVWIGVKVVNLPPRSVEPAQPELVGLGGWLVLVGFGVTIRPLVLLGQMIKNHGYSFDLDVWEALTIPGHATYKPGLGALILGEYVGNTLLLAGSVIVLILFYRRKRAFPWMFVVTMSFNLLVLAADAWATEAVVKADAPTVQAAYRAAGRMLMVLLVWIPYMLVSRRVKQTFTR